MRSTIKHSSRKWEIWRPRDRRCFPVNTNIVFNFILIFCFDSFSYIFANWRTSLSTGQRVLFKAPRHQYECTACTCKCILLHFERKLSVEKKRLRLVHGEWVDWLRILNEVKITTICKQVWYNAHLMLFLLQHLIPMGTASTALSAGFRNGV